MSIISEALKKAEKQANLRTTSPDISLPSKAEKISQQKEVLISKSSRETRLFLVLAIIGIVVSAVILGSIILLKNLTLSKAMQEIQESNLQTEESQNSNFDIELNGIVYEADDRWAIINNRIVRIGDTIGSEQVVEIGKDYVRLINGPSNTERTLILR